MVFQISFFFFFLSHKVQSILTLLYHKAYRAPQETKAILGRQLFLTYFQPRASQLQSWIHLMVVFRFSLFPIPSTPEATQST